MIVQSGAPTAAEKAALAATSSTATGSPSRGGSSHSPLRCLRAPTTRIASAMWPSSSRRQTSVSSTAIRIFSAEERAAFERTLGAWAGVHARGRAALRALGPHRHDVHGSAASAAPPRVGEPGDRQHGRPHRRRADLVGAGHVHGPARLRDARGGSHARLAARAVRWAGHERAQPVARIRRRGLPRMRARRRLPRSPRRLHHGHRDGGP